MCYVDKRIHTSLIIHKALQTIVLYFKLIFCVLYKDQISLFCMRIASFPTLFVEETVFSFYFFGTKDQLYMHGCIFILSVLLQCSIFPHLPSHHAFLLLL